MYLLKRMWSSAINSAIKGPGNIWTQKKRFDSFAPERKHCSATWLVTIKIQQPFTDIHWLLHLQ